MPVASQIDAKSRSSWFTEDVKSIPADAQELLEKYSHIAPTEILPHVVKCRNEAFDVFPYPCIGQLRFLALNLSKHPLYSEILTRLQNGQKLIDVGCCFGQDIRKLVFDRAPAQNIYGLDLDNNFVNLGYKLFRDHETLKATFVTGNLQDASSDLSVVEGKMDIICIISFLHLFDWDEQIKAAKRLVALSLPKKGSIIVGRHLGSTVGEEYLNLDGTSKNYRHNVASFERFWKQVGEETNTNWRAESWLYGGDLVDSNKDAVWATANMRLIGFTVYRE